MDRVNKLDTDVLDLAAGGHLLSDLDLADAAQLLALVFDAEVEYLNRQSLSVHSCRKLVEDNSLMEQLKIAWAARKFTRIRTLSTKLVEVAFNGCHIVYLNALLKVEDAIVIVL